MGKGVSESLCIQKQRNSAEETGKNKSVIYGLNIRGTETESFIPRLSDE